MRGVGPVLSASSDGHVESRSDGIWEPEAVGEVVVFILGDDPSEFLGRIRHRNPGRTSHARRPAISLSVSFFLSTHWLASVEVLVGGSPAFFAFSEESESHGIGG